MTTTTTGNTSSGRQKLHGKDLVVHFLRGCLRLVLVPAEGVLLDPVLLHIVRAIDHTRHRLVPDQTE